MEKGSEVENERENKDKMGEKVKREERENGKRVASESEVKNNDRVMTEGEVKICRESSKRAQRENRREC